LYDLGSKTKAMKNVIAVNLIAISAILFIAGCKEQNEPGESAITGTLTDYSECMNYKSGSEISDDWDTNYCFLYSYNSSGKVLNMKHLNAIFNCCPIELYAVIEEIDDTIIIREFEREFLCSCVCQYDLDFVLNAIERKRYMVKLIVPKDYYATGENPLIFEMDLRMGDQGQYCW